MDHVYEKATGRVVASFADAAGLGHYDPEFYGVAAKPGRIDGREIFRYQAGELTAKPVAALTADKPVITADGQDQAVVSVSVSGADPLPAAIDIDVNGYAETVSLSSGAGQLPPITAEVAGQIELRAVDLDTYYDQGGLVIGAED